MSDIYEIELQRHLWKCELEYRIKHYQGAVKIPWLDDDCDTVEHIADRLRSLGFRIKSTVNEEPWPGELHQWVETTSGIIVYVNTKYNRGLVGCNKILGRWNLVPLCLVLEKGGRHEHQHGTDLDENFQ